MSTHNSSDTELLSRLNQQPLLKARLEALLAVVENAGEDLVKADAAERRVIEELRQLGNDLLTAWADGRVRALSATPPQEDGQVLARSGKKNCTGIVPLVTSTSLSRSIAAATSGGDRLAIVRK